MIKSANFLFLIIFSSSAFAGWDVQNGGGGIFADGTVMTFGAAQIPIGMPEEKAQDIPGLKFLLQKISQLEIDAKSKSMMMMAVTPKLNRIYKKISAGEIDQDLKNELTATYSQLTHVPQDKLVIFAVTDRKLQTTVLLPDFYKLQELEQAVILLHESLWLLNGVVDYAEVINAEIATHKFFTDPKNPDNVFRFYSLLTQLLNRRLFLLNVALRFDHENKLSLLKRNESGQIDFKSLLGEQFLNCYLKLEGRDMTNCRLLLVSDLAMRSVLDPASFSLKALMEIASSADFEIKFETDRDNLEIKSRSLFLIDPKSIKFNGDNDLVIPLSGTDTDTGCVKISESSGMIPLN